MILDTLVISDLHHSAIFFVSVPPNISSTLEKAGNCPSWGRIMPENENLQCIVFENVFLGNDFQFNEK